MSPPDIPYLGFRRPRPNKNCSIPITLAFCIMLMCLTVVKPHTIHLSIDLFCEHFMGFQKLGGAGHVLTGVFFPQVRIFRTASGAVVFCDGWQYIQQFQLNFDFSRLKLVEGFIYHFCMSTMGNTLGCRKMSFTPILI